jgi:lipopolysaccharide export system permease protein
MAALGRGSVALAAEEGPRHALAANRVAQQTRFLPFDAAAMNRIERYVLRTAGTAFLSGLVVLTGIIWITQALRQIDLLTSKGQTILIFLMMTGLALPSLVAFIAPVALFAGILYTLNKLNGDSELVVMAAAGVSPGRLLRPLALLSAFVFVVVASIYIQVLPKSFVAIENLTTYIRADFISNFARPGAFSNLELGFVFHYRERTPDGALRGVFMQDRRDAAHVSTYIAEAGKTVEEDGASYLQLTKGVLLRPQSSGDSAMVTFDDYTIDLSQFMQAISSIKRPRERSTWELMSPERKDSADPALAGHIRSELLDRLASPLYALVGGLIAFAALGEARTTRQGRGLAIGGAILAFVGVRMLGIAATTLTVGVPSASVFVWAVPVAASLGALAMIFRRQLFPTRILPVVTSPV